MKVSRWLRILFWISIVYISLSCIGYAIIAIFRPDITVAQTIPLMVSLFTGVFVAGLLGVYFYGKKK